MVCGVCGVRTPPHFPVHSTSSKGSPENEPKLQKHMQTIPPLIYIVIFGGGDDFVWRRGGGK